jgi:hypothetical protein
MGAHQSRDFLKTAGSGYTSVDVLIDLILSVHILDAETFDRTREFARILGRQLLQAPNLRPAVGDAFIGFQIFVS